MRGKNIFLESLRLHGVTHLFGNPGTTETPLLDCLRQYPEIRYVTTLHEAVAVGAASFYSQASGKTAIVNMHVAPGLGNAIGMMYGALKAKSPIIVTAGGQDTRLRLRNPMLGHDLVGMAAPVVKWSVQANHANEIGPIMQRAFKIANDHPKGPVFVALPIDVLEQESNVLPTQSAVSSLPEVADVVLTTVAELFANAESPAIVAGDDVARSESTAALVALAERTGSRVYLEVLTTHISYPTKHSNFGGRLGTDHAEIGKTLAGHDLVLLIGGPFFEEVWFAEGSPVSDATTVVQLEIESSTLSSNLPLDFALTGEIRSAIVRLLGMVEESDSAIRRNQQFERERGEKRSRFLERAEKSQGQSPMAPGQAIRELGRALPDDVIVVDESLTTMADVLSTFRLGGPHDGYAGRGGGIGQGLAGALGAALAQPNRKVVAISGDGSAMYSIQALWTAAHNALDILFVVVANREYRILKHNTDQYRRRFNVVPDGGYPDMDLADPVMAFAEMSAGMGVDAVSVSSISDIAPAVERALSTPGPNLIELVVAGLER